ncbi:MAG: hypothetical protein JWR19_1831 [Pedosphaera sp.]|nr:hypothetical protein [Pedosphaera sp.]
MVCAQAGQEFLPGLFAYFFHPVPGAGPPRFRLDFSEDRLSFSHENAFEFRVGVRFISGGLQRQE